jgi:hypothetical protein
MEFTVRASRGISGTLLVALIVPLVAVAGCQRKRMPTSTDAELPPRQVDYPEAKARLQKLDPGANVGRVIAVLPDERMASIGEINVQEFQRGQTIQIIGADDQPVASGVVLNIVNDTLHVRYNPVGEGGRRPYVGDIAIRFSMPVR